MAYVFDYGIHQGGVGKLLAGIVGSIPGFSSLTYETKRRDCSIYYESACRLGFLVM